ncbi:MULTISPECIES: ATP-binding cassette domain-containing protein [Brevibacillus]|nr:MULTISPECIES: ATP-binding cassette domain-containing protein [Brevibacillus]MCM3082110.1 ATP-binding cassette domain-containing protein [Brevibacillus invocatus]MCM3432527.1 ATP-binding cassette domain-containing protein [Brevibacillus invocatus]MDH4620141.1 ATP-binding cassette domain-containing protein [Brevibacillus sp. AY1]
MLLLKARGIEKSYGDRQIFRAEELEIANDDRIGIVGRNGSGRTTLMSVLAGDQQPDHGEVPVISICQAFNN